MSGEFAREGRPASLCQFGGRDFAWARGLADPLIDRLGLEWMPEDEALEGINYPNMRAFWACELGLAERRRRGIWRRRWHIRLTRKGWAEA